MRKINWAAQECGTLLGTPTESMRMPQHRQKGAEKIFKRKLPERNWRNSRQEKREEIQTYHRKNAESQRQGETLENNKRKWPLTYGGNPIRLTADFSAETMEARRKWDNHWKCSTTKNLISSKLFLQMKATLLNLFLSSNGCFGLVWSLSESSGFSTDKSMSSEPGGHDG